MKTYIVYLKTEIGIPVEVEANSAKEALEMSETGMVQKGRNYGEIMEQILEFGLDLRDLDWKICECPCNSPEAMEANSEQCRHG